MKREYDKAVEDLNAADRAMMTQMYSDERLTVIREFKGKLDTKIATLMAELRTRCGLDEQWPMQEILKSVEQRVNKGEMGERMISKLYSYDFAENERYQNIMRYA